MHSAFLLSAIGYGQLSLSYIELAAALSLQQIREKIRPLLPTAGAYANGWLLILVMVRFLMQKSAKKVTEQLLGASI